MSVIMVTFNHEAYIREALAGIAAQTYSPLEIVVCDDASADATASIIRDFVAAYRGPHTWRVTVNERNLGILGNATQAMTLARGEWFAYADGDDVSLRGRVEACMRRLPDTRDYVIVKAAWMDTSGNPVPSAFLAPVLKPGVDWNIRHRMPGAWGTCSVHHRRLFDIFGPLSAPGLRLIDAAMAFRAVLLGGQVRLIGETLVRYRQHAGGVVSSRSNEKTRSLSLDYVRRSRDWTSLLLQMALDVQTAYRKELIDDSTCRRALRIVREESYAMETVAQALAAPLPARLMSFARLLADGFAAALRNAYAVKSGFIFRG
ncbi:MAG: glycosyltransferase [Kiritimatiellae bacterium]|nr:glycosyltransferase [Kiritimatiellia bacterium]